MDENASLNELVQHLQLHGVIYEARLIMDAATRYEQNLCYAFVVYKTPQEALATIRQVNPSLFYYEMLSVKILY